MEMNIKTFDTIMAIWHVLFGLCMVFCSVNAIYCVKKNVNKFILSYIAEGATIIVNLIFLYIVDKGYVLYGDNKFSGVSEMDDWLSVLILMILTGIPVIITIVCHVMYEVKRRRSSGGV